MDIVQILTQKGKVTTAQADAIRKEHDTTDESLEALLLKKKIDITDILTAKSELHNIPIQIITDKKIATDVLQYVPEDSARHYKVLPLALRDGVLEVGVVDPNNIDALDALNFLSSKEGVPYKIFLISEIDFNRHLDSYKGLSSEVGDAIQDLESELGAAEDEFRKQATQSQSETKEVPGSVIKEDAPVTKIVATILRYAVEGKASDVHIEPMIENIRVRFRVDGVLHTSLVLPSAVLNAVVARIKILSKMRLDEKRRPQDGRFSATIEGRKIDFRVSTFPTSRGEKVVMRILDTESGIRTLDQLGFSKHNYEVVKWAIDQPYGLILISGPTGSGKSSTLYAMLKEVDTLEKNVLSLEDPVEYSLDGMSQSQMFPEIGYTFASGLRSTLRQDPDIIMVGEIRDKETAQLAIQAALTGHLVFSTIHTNTSAGVVSRLVDMGVDPYLIAPTLILAIAQRLVRKLCPDSGEQMEIRGSLKAMIDAQFSDLPEEYRSALPPMNHMYKAKPSPTCPNGTRGRVAVNEVLQMNEAVEHIILTNPVEDAIYKAARTSGMLTMKEDAIIKALDRIVPFEEINTLGGAMLVDQEGETRATNDTDSDDVQSSARAEHKELQTELESDTNE